MNSQEAKKLEQKVLRKLNQHLHKKDKLILAISGGPDSVFLLKIVEKFSNNMIAAHLNHQLRSNAQKDEEFVKELATKNNIPFYSKKIDIKTLSQKRKKGIEETGRDERYKFLQKIAKEQQAKYILTAHHADDNTETIIMNLVRGSALQGLSGMSDLEKNIFRPLLNISKTEIINYLKSHKIPFRKDPSNLSKKFSRNFIRHDVIPKLQKLNPNLNQTLSRNAEIIKETTYFLNKKASNWIIRNALNDSRTRFSAKTFRAQHPILQKHILRQLHLLHVTNTNNLTSTHIQECLTLINNNIGNKSKKLGKLKLKLNKNHFLIQATPESLHPQHSANL